MNTTEAASLGHRFRPGDKIEIHPKQDAAMSAVRAMNAAMVTLPKNFHTAAKFAVRKYWELIGIYYIHDVKEFDSFVYKMPQRSTEASPRFRNCIIGESK